MGSCTVDVFHAGILRELKFDLEIEILEKALYRSYKPELVKAPRKISEVKEC